MRAFLQLGLAAAFVHGLTACEQTPERSGPKPIWVIEDGTTVVHNPSGIRAPRQAGRFQFIKKYEGERQDLVVIYDAGPEPGAVRVYFSGLMPPVAEPCEALVARRAERVSQRAEFTQQIGPWTDLAPLFAGMEAGRAAVYDSDLNMDGANLPTRSQLYILCGAGGSWFLEYRADYPRDGDGSGWITELIAATAPD
jgi:hypothetical protein